MCNTFTTVHSQRKHQDVHTCIIKTVHSCVCKQEVQVSLEFVYSLKTSEGGTTCGGKVTQGDWYVAWLCDACWGLALIRWRRVFVVWHCWLAFHSSLHSVQSEHSQRWLLFIYTQSWKWQSAGSSDKTSNTGTLQHIVLLQRVPINTLLLLTQTYTSS